MKYQKLFLFILSGATMSLTHAAPEFQGIRVQSDSVGLYEKFEINFNVKAEYDNPFDPDEIDIMATFTSPTGQKWQIPGFYRQASYTLWSIRFSAWETGTWSYAIKVTDKTGSAETDPKTFYVTPSVHHGPIRIAEKNKRYLEYNDGTSYYGIGLWNNYLIRGWSSEETISRELGGLKELGVNFISAYMVPLETIGTGVGRYDQELCNRLDKLLNFCEEQSIILSLNIWFHSYLSETVWSGGNRRWLTNPYQNITPAKEFFSSKKAWILQEQLYRYIIARWSYSRSLGIWFIVDEVNGTDGWASGDSLGAAEWAKKVHDYFKKYDPYQHLTTGTRSGGKKEFWHQGYQIFDLAAREIYEAQGFTIIKDGKIDKGDEHPLRSSYMNYVNEIKRLWNGYAKPAIIGETGWDHSFYEPSMPGYLALYHNALWAGLASGLAMTPFWWSYSDYVKDNVVTRQIKSIANFTKACRFNSLENLELLPAEISNGDAFAIKSEQLILGWVVNPDSDVSGEQISIHVAEPGIFNVQIYHTWRGEFIDSSEIKAVDGKLEFTVPVLKIKGSNARYVGQDIAFIIKNVD